MTKLASAEGKLPPHLSSSFSKQLCKGPALAICSSALQARGEYSHSFIPALDFLDPCLSKYLFIIVSSSLVTIRVASNALFHHVAHTPTGRKTYMIITITILNCSSAVRSLSKYNISIFLLE